MTSHLHYALILAGGSGTRFWPMSRDARPKQLLNLLGTTSLLTQTIERLNPIIPPQNIFILTNAVQKDEVILHAPGIPMEQIIAEPIRRDTAPAIALGIALIKAKCPNATMLVLPSDQLIQDADAFRAHISDALDYATANHTLLTLGITPTWACPSYGYIQLGARIAHDGAEAYHHVAQFREKPDTQTAQSFIDQGNFCWNAGMFLWSIATVQAELAQHCPELAAFIDTLSASPNPAETIATAFPLLTPISIDYALMQASRVVTCTPATFDWDDLGSWLSLASYLDLAGTNRSNAPLTTEDAHDNIVFTSHPTKHVSLLGVSNLIVVETDDAILVADKTKSDDIKLIVNNLPDELR